VGAQQCVRGAAAFDQAAAGVVDRYSQFKIRPRGLDQPSGAVVGAGGVCDSCADQGESDAGVLGGDGGGVANIVMNWK
jgi:hypothetical protein